MDLNEIVKAGNPAFTLITYRSDKKSSNSASLCGTSTSPSIICSFQSSTSSTISSVIPSSLVVVYPTPSSDKPSSSTSPPGKSSSIDWLLTSCTALSTRLMTEVRVILSPSISPSSCWSRSTPIAQIS